MKRFTPWPAAGCAYGAPMGRRGRQLDLEDVTADDLAVSGPAGEYDAGGAYWGHSPSEGPVHAVWVKGKGRDGVAYVRAHDRTHAKLHVLSDVAKEWQRVSLAMPGCSPYNQTWELIGLEGETIWSGVCGDIFVQKIADAHGLEVHLCA